MKFFKKLAHKNNLLLLVLLIVVLVPVLLPLFHTGFFVTDDGEWMIIRFSAFYSALHDGQFPVRFLHRLNFDYGYPVATFLYPGFMYAGVFLHLLKIGFVDTIKIILAISFIGSTVFTYFWLLKLFNKKSAAFLGALVSLYVPYRLYDVYTRGSVGEIFALLWVPFILWMIERKNIFWVSVGIALLLISHNSIGFLFLPVLLIYAFLRKNAFKTIATSFSAGILLSAFFTIPAIAELSLTQFSQMVIADPTQYAASLLLIGTVTFGVVVTACLLFLLKKKFVHPFKGLVFFFLMVTFFATFLASQQGMVVWKVIPSNFLQFPFRLLSYCLITIPFLAAYTISETDKRLQKILFVIIVLLSFWSSYQYISPRSYTDKGEGFYATNEATTTVKDEYMPVWVREKPYEHSQQKVTITRGEGQVSQVLYNNKKFSFTTAAKEDLLVQIHTIYWPGWDWSVDGTWTPVSYNNPQGIMEIVIPEGNHSVVGTFHETIIRLVSDLISLFTLIVLIGISYQSRKKKA